jgi:hypothetical protein
MSSLSRRDLLGAAGVVAAVSTVKLAGAEVSTDHLALVPGMKLGPCTLARLLPVERDALPFELKDPSGEAFVVEAHVHDPAVPGIARAGSLDVFLVNGGDGKTPTHEARGLGAMALATLLAARERAGAPLPELATIAERWDRHPPAVDVSLPRR